MHFVPVCSLVPDLPFPITYTCLTLVYLVLPHYSPTLPYSSVIVVFTCVFSFCDGIILVLPYPSSICTYLPMQANVPVLYND